MKSSLIVFSLFCLSFSLFLSSSLAKDVYLNSTYVQENCINGCNFENVLIWDNNELIENNDNIYIIFNNLTSNENHTAPLSLFYSSQFNFSTLSVEGNVILRLLSLSSLSAQNVTFNNSELLLDENSHYNGYNYILFIGYSVLYISDDSSFIQNGELFHLGVNASMRQSGDVYLYAPAFFHGSYDHEKGDFYSTHGFHVFTQEILFESEATVYYAHFHDSSVFFKDGWLASKSANLTDSHVIISSTADSDTWTNFTVDANSHLSLWNITQGNLNYPNIKGSFELSSSSVTILGTDTVNFPLFINGNSDLIANNLILKDVGFENGYNDEPPNVRFVANILHTIGNITIPEGEVQIATYAYFTGNFIIQDGAAEIQGDTFIEGDFYINGDLWVGNGPQLLSEDDDDLYGGSLHISNANFYVGDLQIKTNATLYVSNSTVKTGTFELSPNSTFHHYNSSFEGDFYFEGKIAITESFNFNGNVSLGEFSELSFHELDLEHGKFGVLNVTGDLTLYKGALLYSLASLAKSDAKTEAKIITARKIEGTFKDPINIGSLVSKASSVIYTNESISLAFGADEHKKKSSSNHWWVWLIVGLAVAIVLILLVVLFLKKRREGYQPVQH